MHDTQTKIVLKKSPASANSFASQCESLLQQFKLLFSNGKDYFELDRASRPLVVVLEMAEDERSFAAHAFGRTVRFLYCPKLDGDQVVGLVNAFLMPLHKDLEAALHLGEFRFDQYGVTNASWSADADFYDIETRSECGRIVFSFITDGLRAGFAHRGSPQQP